VYRKAIDAILNPSGDAGSGIKEATGLVQTIARDLLNGKFPLSKLTITKSLRSEYKDPTRIAHKVLADRIGERDPGNKPSTSDRIPYVYITKKGPIPKLQGDRIELPSYIKEHGLTPDYAFYITNQIAKPVAQVFGLAVEHMPGVKAQEIESCKKARDTVEAREKLASNLLFQTILIESARKPSNMEAKGQRSIASFLKGAPCARIPLEKTEVM
jgi:DNA polymerase elongation subunit (family B)